MALYMASIISGVRCSGFRIDVSKTEDAIRFRRKRVMRRGRATLRNGAERRFALIWKFLLSVVYVEMGTLPIPTYAPNNKTQYFMQACKLKISVDEALTKRYHRERFVNTLSPLREHFVNALWPLREHFVNACASGKT